MGLGLTRDPHLMAGLENMVRERRWRPLFFFEPRHATSCRGCTKALLMPDLDALLKRLHLAQQYLEGARFSFREAGDAVEATCPWGNRIRGSTRPNPSRFGAMRVGMPYVEFELPRAPSLQPLAKFYTDVPWVRSPGRQRRAEVPMPGPTPRPRAR